MNNRISKSEIINSNLNISRNSDDMEEDCFESGGKELHDYQSPLQPNAHLYTQTSNIALPEFDTSCGLSPKVQRYVNFI